MFNIIRNPKSAEKITPETLENQRAPSEYIDAVVATYNNRYKDIFGIDPAKARLHAVKKNSFKPWLADVTLAEDRFVNGKVVETKYRTHQITRQELVLDILTVERIKGESAYATLQKVTTAAGLEVGELTGNLDLKSDATAATYVVNNLSLNYYGLVNVRFTYKDA